MLKNINPDELNNRSSNSENINDSQNIEDNEQEPLCSFDISLNNGKKASLIIFEEDNYKKKVQDFCEKYKISPQDGKVLLKRVKEELEISSNNDNSKIINKPTEEINTNINNNKNLNNNMSNMNNNIPKKGNLYIGNERFIPKEERKLDKILNESESMSLSESVKQSNNKVNNLINDYKNLINNNVQNKVNMKHIPNNNTQNIDNNFNNSLNKEINKPNLNLINNSVFNPNPIPKTNLNNNIISNLNAPKYYLVNDNKNKNKNKKKQILTNPPKNVTNPILNKNNNFSNTQNLNSTYQNNNIMMPNSSKDNNNINNNYDIYSFNPNKTKATFRNSLVGQKIEFIDNNNFLNNNNNKNNIKITTPKTEIKYNNPLYPYSTSPNIIKNENKSITYGYPITSNFNIETSPIINKKQNETVIYNYENPQKINKNNINNCPIVNKINTTKVTKIIDTNIITDDNNYIHQNNIVNSPKSLNINYDNLNKNTYETIIQPEIDFNDYSKNNITTINSPNYNSTTNYESKNKPIIEYNNTYDSINASPILNYDKYDSINNPLVEYQYDTQPLENTNNINNNNNIYNTQSDFPIYENIVIEKNDLNNNNNLNIENNTNVINNQDIIEYDIQQNIVPDYITSVETNNIINNHNTNQIEEVIDYNGNIINNYIENNNKEEKERNTVFISNVKKITEDNPSQNDYINENNNVNYNINEIDIYSDVNQVKSEQNNIIENNYIEEELNNNIIINNNNENNSITKENDINIPRTAPIKVKPENHNKNLSVVQTQNLDYKPKENNIPQKKEKINLNKNINFNEHIENKSNDIYIKKNIDLFNSPKNKIISNNTIKEAINLNMMNEKNNINKKLENNIIQKNIIKENISQVNKVFENENEFDKNINKYKNSNFSENTSPFNKKPINKINNLINNNKNESLTNSNIYEDNNNSENKKNLEKLEESLNQQNINENSSESKIIIEEENSVRGPQDNCKKRTSKVDLPKDTDDSNYKESQIQYDNLSLDSKNNINNKNDKKENNLNNLSESNNDNNNSENKINFINEDDEIINSMNNGSSNYQNSNKKQNKKANHINNNSNNLKTESNYYLNNNNIVNNNKKNKFINYLDKDLSPNRPKYKKNIIHQNLSSDKNKKSNNIYQKKEINNKNKKIIQQKKPIMKVLTIRKTNIDKDNNINKNNNFIIDKRSNSSGAKSNRNNRIRNNNLNNKVKNPGERLYENYMKKLPKKMEKTQKILDERLKEENKDLLLKPKIDENSRRIIKRMRDNENEKNTVEERLINYGNNKRQKHLMEYANKDLQNQLQNPFSPKINKISREIAEKNKRNRINETINLIENKKHKYNFKTMDLDKEFGKRNRSIGNEHKNANSFINFDESKNNNKTKTTIKKHSNINSESNYSNNLNSYRNSKQDNNTIEENNQNSSRLNKTFDLNNAYRELYNSIDEKMDSDLTRFFGTNGELYSDNNNVSKKTTIKKEKKTKSIFPDRSLTPNTYIKNYQNYNAFDYLYYESENKGKKNKKRQELNFKKNHPFKPHISPFAKNMKNKKESMNEFVNRISKNLEEIKLSNSKSKKNKQINSDKKIRNKNDENNNFRPRISRGPKNINQRNVTVNLDGFYDKRITKEKKELQQSKKEDELEKKNLYNQKSKDIIIRMKMKKYNELFNLLDSDKDGFISADKIQLTKVEENVLKNIKPILEELKQTKKEMNFKEFCIKLDRLMTEEKENNHENNK